MKFMVVFLSAEKQKGYEVDFWLRELTSDLNLIFIWSLFWLK